MTKSTFDRIPLLIAFVHQSLLAVTQILCLFFETIEQSLVICLAAVNRTGRSFFGYDVGENCQSSNIFQLASHCWYMLTTRSSTYETCLTVIWCCISLRAHRTEWGVVNLARVPVLTLGAEMLIFRRRNIIRDADMLLIMWRRNAHKFRI